MNRIWHAKNQSKNCAQKLFHKTSRPIHHNVCRLPGQPMAKLCSLVTATIPSAYGKCRLRHLVKTCIRKIRQFQAIFNWNVMADLVIEKYVSIPMFNFIFSLKITKKRENKKKTLYGCWSVQKFNCEFFIFIYIVEQNSHLIRRIYLLNKPYVVQINLS